MYKITKKEQEVLDSLAKGNDNWKHIPTGIVHSACRKSCLNVYKKWKLLGDTSLLEWIPKTYGNV